MLGGAEPVQAAPGDTLFYDNLQNLGSWTVVTNGGNVGTSNQTSSAGRSMRLRWGPAYAYTDAIAANVPAARLELWIRRGDDSFSENPDAGEDLAVEYRTAGGAWVVLDTYLGSGTAGEIYTPSYTLPAAALHANLSIRVRLTAGSGSDNDYWHVDDVRVTELAPPSSISLGTCDDFESGLANWVVTGSGDAGIGTQTASSPTRSLYTRWGVVEVTSNPIDLSTASLADLGVWVRRGDDGFSENPESGDDLVIEYYSSGGAWIALETFDGGGAQGQVYTPTYTLPANALHAAFRIRIRQTNGSGNDFDYWHVDDVCLTDGVPISYTFEEDQWTGASGEVVDGSGNGLHGTVMGGAQNRETSPAIATNPGTCRYGDFDGVDDYVVIPDDPALDILTELTVTVWINMHTLPSELHTVVSKDTNYEFHIDNAGQVYWWWEVANFRTTGSPISLNTWHHIAITFRSGSQTIYVDGVPRATNNYSGTLPQNNVPLHIGTDWDFITRAFDGYIDEVYVLPRHLSQTDVQALMNETHPCATAAAQFTLNHDNFGIHCVPEAITVNVIDSVAGTPLPSYNAEVRLDTQSGSGTWTLVSGGGALVDAVPGDGVALYDWPLGETSAVFSLSYPQGPPLVDVDVWQVTDPGIVDTDAEGLLAFSPNGFTVTAAVLSDPPPNPIPSYSTTRIAAEEFPLHITAYGQTPEDAVCGVIEGYTGAKTLEFWSQYVDPGTGTVNVTIDAAPIATTEVGAFGQAVAFTNGRAQVTAKYKDVGRKQILVKDETTIDVDELPNGIRGATANFVSMPATFVISDIRNAAGSLLNPVAAGANDPVFVAAGEAFRLSIAALDLEGDPTPNYGQEATPEDVRFEVSLVAPLPGQPGTVSVGPGASFVGGVLTAFDFSWSEVGIMRLLPGVADMDYLGEGDVTGPLSENIGRFVPNHFVLSTNDPSFATECDAGSPGFTYTGATFNYAAPPVVTAEARNAAGDPTRNYTGAFFKLSPGTLANWVYASATGTLLPPGSSAITVVEQAAGSGVGIITLDAGSDFSFSRAALDAPFGAAIDLSIDVLDADGVAASNNPAYFDDIVFDDGNEFRYGRLAFTNAVGSERVDLAVPLRAEYFAGPAIGFVPNVADACTDGVTLSLSGFTENLTAGDTCVIDAGVPGSSGAGCAVAGPVARRFAEPPVAGGFNLWLAAPGNTGSLTLDASVPDWLRFDWNTAVPGDENPSAQATFGLFGGETTQIYLREIYN